MNGRVDAVERLLDSKMPQEVSRLVMLIEKNRLEFLNSRDDHDKIIEKIENKMNDELAKAELAKAEPPPKAVPPKK